MSGHEPAAPRPSPQLSARQRDEAIFADLKERVFLAPSLHGDEDLRTWNPDCLRKAHLPPKPPDHMTLARTLWDEALADIKLVPQAPMREFFTIDHTSRHAVQHKTPSGSSQNWSGAVVGIPDNWSCRTLQAQWRIPTAKPGVPAAPNPADHWQGSCWIGLDGDLPGSICMPQLGSKHVADRAANGHVTATASLWWQWWLRDDPNNAPITIPIPVQPGDPVIAILTILSPTCANFLIKHVPSHLGVVFDVLAPDTIEPIPNPAFVRVPIEQQTMEWIVERQTQIAGVDLLAFANYGHCHFEKCAATMTDAAGHTVDMDLTDPITLQMQDWTNQQHPGTLISTYDTGNGPTIKVRYLP